MLKAFEFKGKNGTGTLTIKESVQPETVVFHIDDGIGEGFDLEMAEDDWLQIADLKYKIHCKKAPKPAPEIITPAPRLEVPGSVDGPIKNRIFANTAAAERTAGEEF